MNRAVKITTYHGGTGTQRKKNNEERKLEKIFSVPRWWVLPYLAQEIQLAAFGLPYCKVKSSGQECPLHTTHFGEIQRERSNGNR
jgi:hypothetical protein